MIEKVITFFLPVRLRGSTDKSLKHLQEKRRARTTIYFLLAGGFLSLLSITIRFAIEGMQSSSSLFLVPFAALSNLLVLYVTSKFDKLVIAAWYVVFFASFVIFLRTVSTGGITSATAVWFILVPIVATVSISRTAGIFTVAYCAVLILAISLHDIIGIEVSTLQPVSLVNGIVLFMALSLIFSLTFLYESERLKSEKKIIEYETELARTSKLASLGGISSGLAHEINNPMTVIVGNFEIIQLLLNKETLDLQAVRRHEELITKNLRKIQTVIESFQTYSRSDYKSTFKPIDMKDIIKSSISLIEGNVIPITIEGNSNGKVLGHKGLIERVFHNLLINAIFEVSEQKKPWIRVELEEDDNFISIRFTDSGAGISEEVADKIFDPFFTTKDIGVGSGMGLSLSQNIITIHEAKLFINSESPNTQFVVQFPKQIIGHNL